MSVRTVETHRQNIRRKLEPGRPGRADQVRGGALPVRSRCLSVAALRSSTYRFHRVARRIGLIAVLHRHHRGLRAAPSNPSEIAMYALLQLSGLIDASTSASAAGCWLVLAAVLISAGNAIVRKAFNIGSNAFLEIQWYLFAAVFLLGAGYTLLRNAHVRIDFISGTLSKRTQRWIDVGRHRRLPDPAVPRS